MTRLFPIDPIRTAFSELPQRASHKATEAPESGQVYSPDGHEGALDPNRAIVIGDRGTGKSFWSGVLTHPESRKRIAQRYKRLDLENVESVLGFSDAAMAAEHPSPDNIADLMADGFSAEDLWRAVLLKFAPLSPSDMPDTGNWKELAAWVRMDPARRNNEFRKLDDYLIQKNKYYLVVFDALDVIASNWHEIRRQLEGLIKLCLSVRALRRIRMKLFIRPDMADDRRLWMVGDASKLRQDEVLLRWGRRDLYGLLWTHLANQQPIEGQDTAASFRAHCASAFGCSFHENDNTWHPPRRLLIDESLQQAIFRAIAGDWMGAGSNKGDTYKWVPNHLSDADGNAAPRSFLLAMRTAAQKSRSIETVLDKNGIEEGVRKASSTRILELSEDYRWMEEVLRSMNGLIVPISQEDLKQRWAEKNVLSSLKSAASDGGNDQRLIPPGYVLEAHSDQEAYSNLVEEMKNLRIFLELTDGRINMPDLFRVEAKVKRRGGMRPRA